MAVSIVGLGYVGLATSLILASKNVQTIGVDIDSTKIDLLNNNKIPIREPSLLNLLRKSKLMKTIEFTLDYVHAIKNSDISIICVGTPLKGDKIDLTHLKKSVTKIANIIAKKKRHDIVIKSTVVPGTCDNVIKPILQEKAPRKFQLVANPEFLREGHAVYDSLNPNRIIIGIEKMGDAAKLLKIFRKVLGRSFPVTVITSFVNAELIKYSSNAFLATKVSFANSISDLCERIPNADVGTVMEGIGLDNRIAKSFLNAGVGFGGSCLPKDLQAFISFSNELSYQSPLLRATLDVNRLRPKLLIKKTKEKLGKLDKKNISILGLSFKPNTDDVRNSPSIEIIKSLLKEGAKISVFDPEAMDNVKSIIGNSIKYTKNVEECVANSDCCLILTEWDIFKNLSPRKLVKKMRRSVVIDGRRIFVNKNTKGIDYFCIGKG